MSRNNSSAGTHSASLIRDLGLFDITMIGVGAMIGAGIFVLTGEAAGTAGPALILSFALNGVVTIFTAMVYAELGSAIPEAGGGYLWVKEGLPGSNAFLAGWMSWFAHAVAGALYALGFGAFLFEILRLLGLPLPWLDLTSAKKVFGALVALLFAFINYRGASETGLAGNVVTIAKIAVIGLFCLFGLKFMFLPDLWFNLGAAGGTGIDKLHPFIPAETGWLGVFSAMGLTFIAFEGYEIIVQAGEEVKNPRRNIPKAIFWSLAIVVPIYMLVAFVLVGASNSESLIVALRSIGGQVPASLSADSPNWEILKHLGELGLARAAAQFVPYGAMMILVGGMLSTMSALNATTFSSTRVAFAMGRDRNLPDSFSYISPTRRTPAVALLWTAGLIVLMVVFVPLTTVAAAADIMFLLLFFQVNVAVITIRRKYGAKLGYGYLMPFFPVVPIIGIATKLALALFMFDHYPVAWLYVILWIGVGFALFRLYASEREREKEAPPILATQRALTPRPRSILIPVADPEAACRHVELGARLAKHLESELVLLHAVRVPFQLPQTAASRFVVQARPLLDQVRERAESLGAPVGTIVRTGSDIANAIIHTVHDYRSDFLIMGWKRSKPSGPDVLLGRNIDRVLLKSNCHVIVMQKSRRNSIGRVLVPVADPTGASLALAVAALLVEDSRDPVVTVLHVSARRLSAEERSRFVETIKSSLEDDESKLGLTGLDSTFLAEFCEGPDPVAEISRRSESFDRVIIGTSRGGLTGRKVFGRIPTEVAARARCPVILVRPREVEVRFEVQQFFQFFRELKKEEPAHLESERANRQGGGS